MADETETVALSVPQDITAEQAVLGSILLSTDPQDLIADLMTILEPSDFYRTAHRLIYAAILKLDESQRAIDILTIVDELNKDNQVENVGGMAYLAELASTVPVAGNALYYARIVREKSIRRNMIDTLQSSLTQTYEGADSVDDAVAELSTKLDMINGGEKSADFKNIADVVEKSFEQIEQNSRTTETVTGLASGYPALDNLTTGFHGGEMIIVAARPAVGKTAFVLNIAQRWLWLIRIYQLLCSHWKCRIRHWLTVCWRLKEILIHNICVLVNLILKNGMRWRSRWDRWRIQKSISMIRLELR